MAITVTLNKLEAAGPKQRAIAAEACRLLESALNHPSFAAKVKSSRYIATWHWDGTSQDVRKTPDEVLMYILNGAETGTSNDMEVDLEVELVQLKRGIVGETTLGKQPIHTGYWFINNCIAAGDPVSLAAHFMHEWMHIAGFYHRGGNDARDDVAYVIGNLVQEILASENKSAHREGAM